MSYKHLYPLLPLSFQKAVLTWSASLDINQTHIGDYKIFIFTLFTTCNTASV